MGSAVVLVAAGLLSARLALPEAVAWLVMGAALVVATWMYTAPRPRAAVGWSGWLLRASVFLCLGGTGLPLLGMHLEVVSYILAALLMVAAFAYVSQFRSPFRKVRLRSSTLQWALYVASYVVLTKIIDYLQSPQHPFWRILGWWVVLVVSLAAWSVRRALLPVEVRWWFDNQTGTPGEWVALLVYRDGRAEARWIDERPGWFASEDAALLWLEDNGYLPAERALTERLVADVPPHVLPVARRRKRLRVEQSQRRVRVAADVSDRQRQETTEAIDETDELENAVAAADDSPRRAVAPVDGDGSGA